jgi:HTH-type transcriptional regulator/antitoxin HigA
MNLESQYQLSKLQPVDNSIERKARLHAKFPVRECIRRGWVAATDDIEVLETDVLSFFGVGHIDEYPTLAHAAKKSSYEGVLMPQWAWLFRAKQIAESVVVKKYKKDALNQALLKLKSLLIAPEETRHIPKLLSDAGVRFVLIEALPGSKIDGACLWLSNTQPVIVMSARLDRIAPRNRASAPRARQG